ncbi:uncharacterized protein C2orf42 homolog, partial [Malurus melanocephalus]|uniref:uncharacterized protein C2orf42 homolog n=1 Tax=Malurus melanocephalus TaxID=175006 RepID=UPI002547FA71
MDPSPGRPKAPPSFLSDLGKATLRGIRKCPRCGTYNGTRGLSCKNKTCGTVFRAGARRQPGADAVRVLSGRHGQLYSVRQRDSRCFVELGVPEAADGVPEGAAVTALSSGRCHAPACAKAALGERQCQHLKLALGCQAEATPLPLKSSVLGAVQAPAEAKQSLWELATEPTGPLVQRVTKSVLVVKCKASQRHSLGYLHACFGQRRFSCACRAPGRGRTKGDDGDEEEDEEEEEEEEESPPPRCIHFLACICAFASDDSLAQEFSDFLASVSLPMVALDGLRGPFFIPFPLTFIFYPSFSPFSPFFPPTFYPLYFSSLLFFSLFSPFSPFSPFFPFFFLFPLFPFFFLFPLFPLLFFQPSSSPFFPLPPIFPPFPPFFPLLFPFFPTFLPFFLFFLPFISPLLIPLSPFIMGFPFQGALWGELWSRVPSQCPSLSPAGCGQALDESQVSLSFQEWLASVTERIHQTMHYQFEGRPEPLVFHIPQSFFEALQQRISSGSGKKRLPNATTGEGNGGKPGKTAGKHREKR